MRDLGRAFVAVMVLLGLIGQVQLWEDDELAREQRALYERNTDVEQ